MHAKPGPLSPTEYLEQEQKRAFKCEYVDGEIYAMAGAKRHHNLIASNLIYRARDAAASRPGCQVFGSDMKVYVQAHNSYYYPDLSVCCDPEDRNELFLVKPCFIVEVSSPSTASIDRREKRKSYTSLPSLCEYTVVDQDRLRVEFYRREGGTWRSYVLNQPNDAVTSSCLGLTLTLDEIYEGVSMPTNVGKPEGPAYAYCE